MVVSRSSTICEIDTFMTLLSSTITNCAEAKIAIGSPRPDRSSSTVATASFAGLTTAPAGMDAQFRNTYRHVARDARARSLWAPVAGDGGPACRRGYGRP